MKCPPHWLRWPAAIATRQRGARSLKTCCGLPSTQRNFSSIIKEGDTMYDFDRRSFIKLGSIAAFHWLTLGEALKAQAETKKGDDISVIHLFLTGGMSQMDTFDPKPKSKPEYRSQ